ncbi:UNVERIFIED_CONTAM: hypothetical protein FKN15_046860 [Acipenser sinensis]
MDLWSLIEQINETAAAQKEQLEVPSNIERPFGTSVHVLKEDMQFFGGRAEQFERSRKMYQCTALHFTQASSSSPHLNSDLEQARPQTSGEEELQLQLALAMSREECEKPQRQPPSTVVEIDEDTELQIALSLSKEQHEKDQRSRQGDHSLLQKALEESRLESEDTTPQGESALLDLVDIFSPVSSAPPAGDPWDITATDGNNPWAEPQTSPSLPALSASDPWDTVVYSLKAGNSTLLDLVDIFSPVSSAPPAGDPWDITATDGNNPWAEPQTSPSPPALSASDPWDTVVEGRWFSLVRHLSFYSIGDQHSRQGDQSLLQKTLEESRLESEDTAPQGESALLDLVDIFSPVSSAPPAGDPWDITATDGNNPWAEPQTSPSPPALSASDPWDTVGRPQGRAQEMGKSCYTPETNGVHREQHSRFITGGLSTPSPTNPFHSEQPRLTLNQMRTPSGSPQPGSLSYSTSLPLPLSSLPAAMSLPSSLTQPTASGATAFAPPACLLDIPSNLPQPLLPMAPQQPEAPGRNPFL